MNSVLSQIQQRARLLTAVSGSLIVAIWTVLRHISNGINFDVVGQIGLAQQWAHGIHAGAQLGATNYVLKMPLYTLVNSLGFLSPMNRLLALALVCNVATFLLLFVLFEKIGKLYGRRNGTWLCLAMLWLATIAGNVFWTDYANSRNLETVGGVLFIYLVLKFIRSQWIGTAVWCALVGSLVFFADSLQFYVCGLGICVFVVSDWLRHRVRSRGVMAVKVLAIVGAGYAGARLIRLIVEHWLHVSFLAAPKQPFKLDGPTISHSLHNLFSNTLAIFGANVFKKPYDLNSLRELLGLLVLVSLLGLLVRSYTKLRASVVVGLAVAIMVINYLIYLASGQVLVAATYRYLVMLPLVLALVIGTTGSSVAEQLTHRQVNRLQLGWLAVSVLSSIMLLGALILHWPDRHSGDTHIYTTTAYLQTNGLRYTLSSREAGVTTTYFAHGNATVLPLLCTPDHRLVATDLFYDKAAFANFRRYDGKTAIIAPGGAINSGAAICDLAAITMQFGPAMSQQDVTNVGTVLTYTPAQLQAGLPVAVAN